MDIKKFKLGINTIILAGSTLLMSPLSSASEVFTFDLDGYGHGSSAFVTGDYFSISFVDDSNFLSGISSSDFESVSFNVSGIGSSTILGGPTSTDGSWTDIFNFTFVSGEWGLDLEIGHQDTFGYAVWSYASDRFQLARNTHSIYTNLHFQNDGVSRALHDQINPITLNSEISVVPVPAAAWLFGSALVGFAGWSRRKNKTA